MIHFSIPQLNTFFDPGEKLEGILTIWGDSGVGKTTFALQTALLAIEHQKTVLYFYSKPNLPNEKISSLANGRNLSPENMEMNFYLPKKFKEFHDAIFSLEFLILKSMQASDNQSFLLIIDSFSEMYRMELDRSKKGRNLNLNYQLNEILGTLAYLNQNYELEILLVNDLARISTDDYYLEVQSGGKVMDYWTTYSLKISRNKGSNSRMISLFNKEKVKLTELHLAMKENGFTLK